MPHYYTVLWSWLTSKLRCHTRAHRGDAQHIPPAGLGWKDVMVEKQCPCFALSAVNFLNRDLWSTASDVKISKWQPPTPTPHTHSPKPRCLHLHAFPDCMQQRFETLPTQGKEVPTSTTEARKLLRSKSPAATPAAPRQYLQEHPRGSQLPHHKGPPALSRRVPTGVLLAPGLFPLHSPYPGPRGQVGPGVPGHTERRGQTKGRRPPPRRYRHGRPRARNAGSGPRPAPEAPSSLRRVPTARPGGSQQLPAMGREGPRPHARLRRHGDRAAAPRT